MSVYPHWWSAKLTVNNRFEDEETGKITWYRTYVDGSFWKPTGTQTEVNNVTVKTDDIIARIRKDARYVSPDEWRALSSSEKLRHFTLDRDSIIAYGHTTESIDESGQAGLRPSSYREKHKTTGVMGVKTTSVNTSVNAAPHYYARGV